jgi:hypothetical protein
VEDPGGPEKTSPVPVTMRTRFAGSAPYGMIPMQRSALGMERHLDDAAVALKVDRRIDPLSEVGHLTPAVHMGRGEPDWTKGHRPGAHERRPHLINQHRVY